MASNIKGIKIEIDGNTQPLQKALKDVNKAATEATKELKSIDKALKFDTNNVTLLGQKQEVLQKQVASTKEKLETLRQAQSQVEQQFKNGDIGADQYRAFKREIEVTQNVLKGYEGQLANVNKALSSNGGATDDNKAKLSSLQNEQSRLASESEKVVSSFKLQESQLGRNASEADKLALAEKKVAAQTDIVKQQIGNLERQLELTKQEYGENSAQANKMETELNQAKSTLNALNNELRETGGASNTAQSGMEDMANIMRAEALAQVSEKLGEISQKLLDVGWQSMEAAASLQASNAQFSTVFGDLESQARSSLDKIGSDLQIVPERLQGSFTQMAAFAKTAGFETADALDLTERATRAAADGAAFYDKSIEEVTENLQSFLKGNFANDAALGISATETTRNAKANELYGQSFKDLSEAQKQLTLLAMVEDGNKVSGALGQASREADGFENILGNLKQSGENAMASLGQPILEAMIPVFKMLSEVVQNVARWFTKLATPIKQFIFFMGAVITAIGLVLPPILAMQAAAALAGTTIGGMLAPMLPVIGTILAIAAAAAVLVIGFKHLWETNEEFRAAILNIWSHIQSFVTDALKTLDTVIRAVWGGLLDWWSASQYAIKQLAKTAWQGVSGLIKSVLAVINTIIRDVWGTLVNWWVNNQRLILLTAQLVWYMISGAITMAINGINAIVQDVFGGLVNWWSENNEEILSIVYIVWETVQKAVASALQAVTLFVTAIFGDMVRWWLDNQELIKSTAETVWASIKKVISATAKVVTAIIRTMMTYLGPFLKNAWRNIQIIVSATWKIIRTVIEGTLKNIMGIIKAVMQAINGDWSGAWKTLQEVARNTLNMMLTVIRTALSTILSVFTNSWNTMLSVLSNVFSSIFSLAKSTWSNLTAFLSSTWSNIASTASNNWNAILTSLQFIWNSLYNAAMSIFNSTKDFIANIWSNISSTAVSIWSGGIIPFLNGIWNGILSTASNIFNTIRDTIANVWNSVSTTASNVWNGIKNTIANAINAIIGLFNFEWSLPRPKIPRFHISGGQAPWGFGGQGSLPSISVEWFAKGGILTKPTAFGMVGNKLAVGGEAGAEAVLPLNERTLGMIADRIMATVTDKIVVNVPQQQPQPIILNIDGKTFAQLMVGHISELQADRLRIVEAGGTI